MCWWCGAIRPGDGPSEFALRHEFNTEYRIGDVVYVANEEADWEDLIEFPSFDSEFFITRPATEEDIPYQNIHSIPLCRCWNCGYEAEVEPFSDCPNCEKFASSMQVAA
jgi:hypothetical protein